ncbi:hypothetical protein ABVV53_10340 [Novosphingobium sp. RD2P27]|uniref:Secreted protein n=1 Tax=Novosphingobium kalidii TaxID=3230299 RepID=A0ABV2D2K1_9SPHN
MADSKPARAAVAAIKLGAVGAAGVAAATIYLDNGSAIARAEPASPVATQSSPTLTPAVENVFRNGQAGFVVTDIAYALGPDGKAACPKGMTAGVRGLIEAYAKTPAGQRREDEPQRNYERRLGLTVHTAPDGQNLCMFPAAGGADPGWRMVHGRNLKVEGIDLDGAGTSKKAAGATCGHEEFQGLNGERGVDNQFYRVVGCTTGFQPTGQANGFQVEMHTGSWGILMTLKGVDDPRNDPEVEVGFFANSDPIQLSAARAPLSHATYATESNPRYRATTRGRIVDGVLTSDPVDVRFHNVVNSMNDDRELRSARVRMTFTPDGGLEGILAGYTPVESMYDLQFGARRSKTAKGELAPERLRLGTSMGRAGALGYSCHGAYHAMLQAADGHKDPATGRCTSISTQYRIRLAPAFVVEGASQSAKSALVTG